MYLIAIILCTLVATFEKKNLIKVHQLTRWIYYDIEFQQQTVICPNASTIHEYSQASM